MRKCAKRIRWIFFQDVCAYLVVRAKVMVVSKVPLPGKIVDCVMKSTQVELDAAVDYDEELKPSCVDAGVSYEERVARRKEEIESLQEALKIRGAGGDGAEVRAPL